MRVQLGNERGATAIIVAIMMIVLVGIVAFTVDLGRAYASKRQLQTAADAASLAAAGVYAEKGGSRTCEQLKADAALRAEASAAANAIAQENRPEVTPYELQPSDITCESGNLRVRFPAEGTTEVIFGQLISNITEITTEPYAAAQVDVPPQVGGLRPYAVCAEGSQFPGPGSPRPSQVYKVSFPPEGSEDPVCPAPRRGNWWTVNCPEGANNSSGILADKTRNGCDEPVSVVEPQGATPETLYSSLLDGCSGGVDEDCLGADPGNNFTDSKILNAWDYLLGQSITLPVFCTTPTCSDVAVVDIGGNNAKYPVYRLAGVRVCGYHWGKQPGKWGQVTDGTCATSLDASDGGNSENYLLLSYENVQVSGGTGESTCSGGLGSGCDGGTRRTLLVE